MYIIPQKTYKEKHRTQWINTIGWPYETKLLILIGQYIVSIIIVIAWI